MRACNRHLLVFLLALLFFSCSALNNHKPCLDTNFPGCSLARQLWQEAIDTVVLKNFPNKYKWYKAVVWDDSYDNAWVSKGREVNITKQFISKINYEKVLAVAAHELAHLQMGHYYARNGIIILNSPEKKLRFDGKPPSNVPVKIVGNIVVPKGFGDYQEQEADVQALIYLKSIGVKPKIYLDLLNLFVLHSSNKAIEERIQFLKGYLKKNPK